MTDIGFIHIRGRFYQVSCRSEYETLYVKIMGRPSTEKPPGGRYFRGIETFMHRNPGELISLERGEEVKIEI